VYIVFSRDLLMSSGNDRYDSAPCLKLTLNRDMFGQRAAPGRVTAGQLAAAGRKAWGKSRIRYQTIKAAAKWPLRWHCRALLTP
jgi:hypothetical protein